MAYTLAGVNQVSQRYEEAVQIDRLQPHPLNANEGDRKVIAESIEENGFYGAVYAHEPTGYIIAGNHRWEQAKLAGAETLPVIWLDVDEKRAGKILAVDNRAARLGRDDSAKLATLLESFEGDFVGTGYVEADLSSLLAKLRPEAPESFPSYGEGIATESECPRCGYRWSGGAAQPAIPEG